MTEWLILSLLAPAIVVPVVLLLGFTGCDRVFGITAFGPPFRQYTPTILNEPTLVAYWPLGEAPGETTAVDLKGGRNGTYFSQVFPDDPSFPSAAAPGTLILGQAGIVTGDTLPPYDDHSPHTTCIEVNGGYVSVPFDPALNPTKVEGFTLEVWVRPGWSGGDPAAVRDIMTAFDTVGGLHGYVLLASQTNTWQGAVGTGSGLVFASGPDVQFDTPTHIVLTYDGSQLRLYVNGSQASAVAADYQPSTQSRLFIGAGRPDLPEPRVPWVGNIQCVALYKGALSSEQVAKHAGFGKGQGMS